MGSQKGEMVKMHNTDLIGKVGEFSDQLHSAAKAGQAMVPEVLKALERVRQGRGMSPEEVDLLRITSRSILCHSVAISRAGDALDLLATTILESVTNGS